MPVRQIDAGIPPVTRAHDLEHVEQLFERLGLGGIVRHMPPVALWAMYVFVNGFLSIGLLALLAIATGVPFVFPSVGPTAYHIFFLPRAGSSTPRNTLIAHFIGLTCGYAAYRISGIPVSEVLAAGAFNWRPAIAAALSLSVTAALMIVLDASHPPAGATALIVSLGIITKPRYLAAIEIAVFVVVIQAFIVHRLAGLPYPVWKTPPRGQSRN